VGQGVVEIADGEDRGDPFTCGHVPILARTAGVKQRPIPPPDGGLKGARSILPMTRSATASGHNSMRCCAATRRCQPRRRGLLL
jgi:hypothetical protein